MKLKPIIITDADDVQHVMPSHFVICGRCEGCGTHDHPAFSNGITSSEWSDMDQDDRDSYMGGAYDVTCEECKGARVVVAVDYEALTPEQRAIVEVDEQAAREYEAECRNERRMMGYF